MATFAYRCVRLPLSSVSRATSACIADEKRAAFLPQDGVVVNQTKYTYLRHDPGNSIYAATGTTGGVREKNYREIVERRALIPICFGLGTRLIELGWPGMC